MDRKLTSTNATRKLKSERISQWQCIDCGKPHQTGYLRCQECLDIQAEYARQRRLISK